VHIIIILQISDDMTAEYSFLCALSAAAGLLLPSFCVVAVYHVLFSPESQQHK
jgi:hypothetical protein